MASGAFADSEGAHPAGGDQAQGDALAVKGQPQGLLVVAGGFEDHQGLGPLLEAFDERGDALLIVGHAKGVIGALDLKGGFADVNTNPIEVVFRSHGSLVLVR